MKRPISNITQDSIKPLLSNAVEFYTNKNREAHKLIQERDEYINHLESKLSSANQQQALPVVPEFVGNFLSGKSIFKIANGNVPDDVISWVQEQTYYVDLEKIISHLISLKITGYQVEKPQLFRVCLLDGRHTLTRRDPRKTLPFNYTFLWSYSSELKEMREINRKVDLFTEQEIKSIDERYWQFAMPVEDGE